jgi:hypothetical protein
MQKVYLSRLMRVYVGLVMLAACPGFLGSYWSARFGTFSQESALASHWLEPRELCKFYADAGGKQPIQRQPLLVQYKQQANPLLSMNSYNHTCHQNAKSIS